jgi:hypothetical protein
VHEFHFTANGANRLELNYPGTTTAQHCGNQVKAAQTSRSCRHIDVSEKIGLNGSSPGSHQVNTPEDSHVNPTRIVINGKEYHSWDEVPEECRKLLKMKSADLRMITKNGVTTYQVADKEYPRLEDVPVEYRALFEDRDGDGKPDFLKHPEHLLRLADPTAGPQGLRLKGSPILPALQLGMNSVNGVTTYTVGDRTFQSLAEVPAEYRAFFENRDADGLPAHFRQLGRWSALDSPDARKEVVVQIGPIRVRGTSLVQIVLIVAVLTGLILAYVLSRWR